MLNIAVAQPHDINAMLALDALVTGAPPRQRSIAETVHRQRACVAYINAELCGFLLLHEHFFDYPFIELLIVHPLYRRQGIGTALMRTAETSVVSTKIFTSTNTSNAAMQQLCTQLGYLHCGTLSCLDEEDPEEFYCKYLA